MNHSPLPWQAYRADEQDIFVMSGHRYVAKAVDYGHGCGAADAEFIVRCVNSHEDMLAALKEWATLTCEESFDLLERTHAAIAKAEGK
jgi:hypothetical protein